MNANYHTEIIFSVFQTHWNLNFVILTKFQALSVTGVVIVKVSETASDGKDISVSVILLSETHAVFRTVDDIL